MLVSTSEMLKKARREGYAVCGFESWDSASIKAIITAAEAEMSPVIVQASSRELDYAGIHIYSKIATEAAKISRVPVAVHLDHGADLDLVMKCIRHGFTSVMIDASKLPFEHNLELTKEVVKVAHAVDVSVEAMLGIVGQTGEGATALVAKNLMTDPVKAASFVAETGVDCLAVSIGSVSGMSNQIATLDLERLADISKNVSVPLVLHGGSGVPVEQVRRAIKMGIARMHIATALWQAYHRSCREHLTSAAFVDGYVGIYPFLESVQKSMQNLVRNKIRLYGSQEKADS